MFVCADVLRLGEVMLKAVSLLAALLLNRLSPLGGWPVLCTFFRQELKTTLLESVKGREWL